MKSSHDRSSGSANEDDDEESKIVGDEGGPLASPTTEQQQSRAAGGFRSPKAKRSGRDRDRGLFALETVDNKGRVTHSLPPLKIGRLLKDETGLQLIQ